MHGLGNDFIMVDNLDGAQQFPAERVKALADRHFGVGFDQMLIVEKPTRPDAEFDYRIFNYDGSEVEHCGNGARCFAKFVRDRGLTDSRAIKVNTSAGIIELITRDDEQVTVKMGIPTFDPVKIPLDTSIAEAQSDYDYVVRVGEQRVVFSAVAIGNPHAVIQVDDVATAPVETLGAAMESHPAFPNRVNVGFMQFVSPGHIRLRVFERGVGETRACGTGACAAFSIARQKKLLDKNGVVTLSGGDLSLHWQDIHSNIEMTGPCTKVFEGQTRM